MKEYERQMKKEEKELAELAAIEQAGKVEKFVKAESNIMWIKVRCFNYFKFFKFSFRVLYLNIINAIFLII